MRALQKNCFLWPMPKKKHFSLLTLQPQHQQQKLLQNSPQGDNAAAVELQQMRQTPQELQLQHLTANRKIRSLQQLKHQAQGAPKHLLAVEDLTMQVQQRNSSGTCCNSRWRRGSSSLTRDRRRLQLRAANDSQRQPKTARQQNAQQQQLNYQWQQQKGFV